jgi:alkylhydroperoxidase family enzyme
VLGLVVGLPLSALFLWLAIRGVSFDEVWDALASANPWLVALAIPCLLAIILFQGLRWRALIGDGADLCRGALFSQVCNPLAEARQRQDERVREFRANGRNITGLTVPRSAGGVTGLSTPHFFHSPSWNELRTMEFEQRLTALRDASFREKLVAELKRHWDEGQIVEIIAAIGLFGYLNRWNDTMATQLESEPTEFAESILSDGGWALGKHKG